MRGRSLVYRRRITTNKSSPIPRTITTAKQAKFRAVGAAPWPREWNLKGEVTSEQYERLVAGQDPHTGEQLIRVVSARETVNKFGEEITTSEHRAAWDATFSAPKYASLAAFVGGDRRIRDYAHRESVNEAL